MPGASFTERESRLVGDVRPPLDVVLKEEGSYIAPEKAAVDVSDLFADNAVSLVDAFKEFDEDGSGSISRQEFAKGLKSMASKGLIREVDDRQFRELVGKLDKDGDGDIGALVLCGGLAATHILLWVRLPNWSISANM